MEKAVRKASGKELFCSDEKCEHRLLKYCHGDVKQAYFAHLVNTDCLYDDCDKNTTEIIKEIKRKLYQHFKEINYDVNMDVKLVDRHYTHLVIYINKIPYAIEILSKFSTVKRIDKINDQYKSANISVNWIVTDRNVISDVHAIESEMNFAKRFSLNETSDNTLIAIDLDGNIVKQHRMDMNKYEYDGLEIHSNNYPKIFARNDTIEHLVFTDGKLSLIQFNEQYQNYISKKKRAFDKRIAEQERQLKEEQRQEHAKTQQERQKEKSFDEIAEILNDFAVPPYKPSINDQILKWDKEHFIKIINELKTDTKSAYGLMLLKIRYGSEPERRIFSSLYSERNDMDYRVKYALERLWKQISSDLKS